MQVEDAGYFSDGYGIAEGDTIQLDGQTVRARVLEVDREANVLVLDRALRWQAGQGVALAYEGQRPDIGAYE
jgi:hypothetical protein